MTTQLKGKTATEAVQTFKEFHDIVKSGQAPDDFNELAAFAGVHALPGADQVRHAGLARRP